MERTTNLQLKKPGLDDDALISDLNDNSDVLDSKIGPVGNVSLQTQISNEVTARQQADSSLSDNIAKLQQGIAIIVDGDTASVAVPVGGYAYLKNNTHGLADGLYKNTSSSAFPVSGGTADSTVFITVPTGAVNDLNNIMSNKANKANSISERTTVRYSAKDTWTQVDGYVTIPAHAEFSVSCEQMYNDVYPTKVAISRSNEHQYNMVVSESSLVSFSSRTLDSELRLYFYGQNGVGSGNNNILIRGWYRVVN